MRLQETETFIGLQAQLVGLGLDSEERLVVRCKLAKEFEDSGDYKEAARSLAGYWYGVGVRPELAGLKEITAAEILLRVGCLTSRFGKEEGINGAQESAISLIKEGLGIYESLGEVGKVGECFTELGSCYWRRGDYEDARAALSMATALLKDFRNETRAVALIRAALVENSAGKHYAAYSILRDAGELVAELNSHKVSGLYHNTLANILLFLSHNEELAYSILGERNEQSLADRALIEYAASGYHFEEAGHSRFAARVLNNTGLLLLTRGSLDEAHEYLDRARAILVDLDAESSVAQVDETRARVLIDQRRIDEAVEVAGAAVEALRRGDDAGQLAQALTTYGRALARNMRYAASLKILEEAIATAGGDKEGAGQACLTMIEELAHVLPAYELWALYARADAILSGTQRPETIGRLRACAHTTLSVVRHAMRADLKDGWTGCSLLDEVLRYEHDLIAQAMAAEDGRITDAARRLQTKHQTLRHIIDGRHKDTLGKEYPARSRRIKGQ